jgi:hypothetical protein
MHFVAERVHQLRDGWDHSDCWLWLQRACKSKQQSSSEYSEAKTNTWCSCAVIKAGISSSFAHQISLPKIQRFQLFIIIIIFSGGRSSLNNGHDKTTYGAFLDVDPSHEELSLRGLVSCCYEIVIYITMIYLGLWFQKIQFENVIDPFQKVKGTIKLSKLLVFGHSCLCPKISEN